MSAVICCSSGFCCFDFIVDSCNFNVYLVLLFQDWMLSGFLKGPLFSVAGCFSACGWAGENLFFFQFLLVVNVFLFFTSLSCVVFRLLFTVALVECLFDLTFI